MAAAAQMLDIISDLAKAHEQDDKAETASFQKQASLTGSSNDESCTLLCVT
jgi:hypothetical protein